MGVTKNFKAHYRSRLNARIIATLDTNFDLRALDVAKSTSLLDALHLAKESWAAVLPSTICNCFRIGGFTSIAASDCTDEMDQEYDVLGDVAIPGNMTEEEFIAFVDIDKEEVAREMTDSELLKSVARAKNQEAQDEQNSTPSDDEIEASEPSLREQLEAAETFRNVCQFRGFEVGYKAAQNWKQTYILNSYCKKRSKLHWTILFSKCDFDDKTIN